MTRGYSGDNGPATSAQLSSPRGVAVDSAGNLYVADTANSRIRKISNGMITSVAGNGTQGFSGDNGPATSARLFEPVG
jgi:trimeric autotransporter adhesin